MVFVHGGPGQGSHHFAALTGPSLEDELQLVYFDQRDSGRSERTREGYDIATMSEDLERLREVLGTERISLIGHSFGALWSLEYAAKYPDHVARVVLVAPGADVRASTLATCERLALADPPAFERAIANAVMDGLCNPFVAYSGSEREEYDRSRAFPDSAVARALAQADGLGGLGNTGVAFGQLFSSLEDAFSPRFTGHDQVQAAVLVIAGEEDGLIGLDVPQDLVTRLPEAELNVFGGAGHFPYLDEPELFARVVVEFLHGGR